MRRVLVTGSRDWEDWETIFNSLSAIKEAIGDFVLVHGGARGADEMAGLWAYRNKVQTEVHPAEWGKYGTRAGYIRNDEMVKSGPDMVLAYIKNNSKGASMCASLAEKAGIPIKYFRED